MDIEEAIRILDPETTREALEPYAYDPKGRVRAVNKACRIVVAALRAQQAPLDRSRWEGCAACSEARESINTTTMAANTAAASAAAAAAVVKQTIPGAKTTYSPNVTVTEATAE